MPIPEDILAVERPKSTRVLYSFGRYLVVKRTSKRVNGRTVPVDLGTIGEIKDGKYEKSSTEKILAFRDTLNDQGIVATVRRELGSDIAAACGQLVRDQKTNVD